MLAATGVEAASDRDVTTALSAADDTSESGGASPVDLSIADRACRSLEALVCSAALARSLSHRAKDRFGQTSPPAAILLRKRDPLSAIASVKESAISFAVVSDAPIVVPNRVVARPEVPGFPERFRRRTSASIRSSSAAASSMDPAIQAATRPH